MTSVKTNKIKKQTPLCYSSFSLLETLLLGQKDLFTLKALKLDFVFIQFHYKTSEEALAMFYIMLFIDFEKENVQQLGTKTQPKHVSLKQRLLDAIF